MANETDPVDNADLLLAHLKDDSLAARLVRAHQASHAGDAAERVNAVLAERLEQIKAKLDDPAD